MAPHSDLDSIEGSGPESRIGGTRRRTRVWASKGQQAVETQLRPPWSHGHGQLPDGQACGAVLIDMMSFGSTTSDHLGFDGVTPIQTFASKATLASTVYSHELGWL